MYEVHAIWPMKHALSHLQIAVITLADALRRRTLHKSTEMITTTKLSSHGDQFILGLLEQQEGDLKSKECLKCQRL